MSFVSKLSISLLSSTVLLCATSNTSFAVQAAKPVAAKISTASSNVSDLEKKKKEILSIREDDLLMGSKDAKITMIEYASLSCSHCAAFSISTLSKIEENYVKQGKVNVVYRDYPLDLGALQASQIVRCAPKEKAFSFIKSMFATQENWVGNKNYLEILSNIAKLGGMPSAKIDACLKDEKNMNKVIESKKEAADFLEIKSTPTIFINGIKYEGDRSYAEMSKYLDGLLKDTEKSAKVSKK